MQTDWKLERVGLREGFLLWREANVGEEDQEIREPARGCEIIQHVACAVTQNGSSGHELWRWPQLWDFILHHSPFVLAERLRQHAHRGHD